MDEDNILNINDAMKAMKHIVEDKADAKKKQIGDVDNNKKLDLIDVINIGRATEGKDIVREKLNKVGTDSTHETIELNTNLAPSVYEQWLVIEKRNRPTLTDSEDTFKSFIKKLTGPKGPTGDSVYHEWKKISGNEKKTIKDFLDNIKGPKGADGKAALPVVNKTTNKGAKEIDLKIFDEDNFLDKDRKSTDIFKINNKYYTNFKKKNSATIIPSTRIQSEKWDLIKTYKSSNIETIVSHNEKLYKFIGENNSTAHNPDDENYRSIWIPYGSTRSTNKLSTDNFTEVVDGVHVIFVENGARLKKIQVTIKTWNNTSWFETWMNIPIKIITPSNPSNPAMNDAPVGTMAWFFFL